MDAATFAARLNGREYRNEITEEECAEAREHGLVVIFGASDDLMEFRGFFNDELGAYGGTLAHVAIDGIVPDWESLDHDDEEAVERYMDRKRAGFKVVEAVFDEEGFTWIFKTDVPHATFIVNDDGEQYCRGIVVSINDL